MMSDSQNKGIMSWNNGLSQNNRLSKNDVLSQDNDLK